MRSRELDALLKQRLFEPFRLHLSNGITFDVRHPKLMAVGRSIAWLETALPEDPVPIARRRIGINLLHIVWIEFIDAYPEPGLN